MDPFSNQPLIVRYVPVRMADNGMKGPYVMDADGFPHVLQNTGPMELVGNKIGYLCCFAVELRSVGDRHLVQFFDGTQCWVTPFDQWVHVPDVLPKWVNRLLSLAA
jgi:hypothetical protein